MTQPNKEAIRFENVSYSVGDVSILTTISGIIIANQITTLVGPSGSGKTTLLKLCNGLISPTTGDIWIEDRAIDSYDPVDLRRKIGFALQSAPMIRGTVYDNLALPLTLQNKELPKKEALHYLDTVGLEHKFLTHNAADLSGGQRQKVSIARTLVNESPILLLDEITSALDQTSAHDIEQLIRNINDVHGKTIIWITHDLTQAKELGDYTWIMADGKVVETGTSDILHHPATATAQRFIEGGQG